MYKIELSISTAMSLQVLSSAGSDEPEEIDEDMEIDDNDVADVILSTSDEDFEKLSPEDFEKALTGETEDVSDTDVGDTLGDDDEEDDDSEVNEDEPTDTAEEDGSEQTEDDTDSDGDQPNEDEQPATVDAKQMKEAYDLLFGNPIKASGREVQIRNPQHAKNFIEMGIDYNKKMQSMRPHLKTLKTLEKEGLLDDMDKLNLLLEVKHGNKDALKRLIAESDIDPLDLADEEVIEAGRNYKPQNHMVSEKEVEIEEALNSIEGTPTQQRTLDVMTKEFDQRSREIISDNPSYIVALNQDMESGAYDEVMDAVNYRRDMKRVPAGMSDMELYIETAEQLSQAKDNMPLQQNNQTQQKKQRGSTKQDKARMSGTKSSRKPQKKEYDPMEVLGMDDAKFELEMGHLLD